MFLQKLLTPVVLASLLIGQGYPAAYAQQAAPQLVQQPVPQAAPQSLNNEAVIKLVKAGLSDDLIVSTIASSPGIYDISADGMIALKAAGVSDRVVSAIMLKTNAAALPAPPPVPPLPPTLTTVLLTEGSDVYLVFDQDLSSKTATDGDTVEFVLSEDIKVGNVVVAKTGTKAVGEVTNAKKSEMMGKGGELNIRLNYLKVGNAKVHLRGTKGGEGNSGVGGAIALTLLVGVFGLLKHGKEVKVQKGTALHAYVSDDISLPPAI
jgi:hypothetical protein